MKKIIALLLILVLIFTATLSLTGCDFGKEDKPPVLPPVDPNAPVYMQGSGVLTLFDVKRSETKEGFETIAGGSSSEYKISMEVVLDMKENKNNKINISVFDRINEQKIIASITYNGMLSLFVFDFATIGLGTYRLEGFDLTKYIRSIDFASMVPPEFEEMLPEGTEIEIDFDKIDMMDYLMSILYSMDTTALVITDKTISEMKKEEGEEISFNEPFEITVGVFSEDGLFESVKINHSLSGTKVFEIKLTQMKFHDGTISSPIIDNGVDLSEKDTFKKLKEHFDEMAVGDGFVIDYELRNGYRTGVDGEVKTVQNEMRVVKKSRYECQIDFYQKILGEGAFNHLFNIVTYDFEEWTVTLKGGISYAVESATSREAVKRLIDYVDPFVILSDSIRTDASEEDFSLGGLVVKNFDGLEIKQSSMSALFTYYFLPSTINAIQADIISELKSKGFSFDASKGESIADGIARDIMSRIGDDILDIITDSMNDKVIADIINGILGNPDVGGTVDSLYKALSVSLTEMLTNIMEGVFPLPELENCKFSAKLGQKGIEEINATGGNGKVGDEKRYFKIAYLPNMA